MFWKYAANLQENTHAEINTKNITLVNSRYYILCILCHKSYPLDFVIILPFMAESSWSRGKAIWLSKILVECLQTSYHSGLISWEDLIVKLFTKNVCGFYKCWKRLPVKLKKIIVNYVSTTNQINIYLRFFLKKSLKSSSYRLQLKAYNILLYSKLR